jgi:hypothetical protein
MKPLVERTFAKIGNVKSTNKTPPDVSENFAGRFLAQVFNEALEKGIQLSEAKIGNL